MNRYNLKTRKTVAACLSSLTKDKEELLKKNMATHNTGRHFYFYFLVIFTNATSFTYRSEQIFNRITIICRVCEGEKKKQLMRCHSF